MTSLTKVPLFFVNGGCYSVLLMGILIWHTFYSQKRLLTYSILLQLVHLTGYDSIFDEYLLTTILLRNTVPSIQLSWDDQGQVRARGYCRFFEAALKPRGQLDREKTGGVGGLHLMRISPTHWTSRTQTSGQSFAPCCITTMVVIECRGPDYHQQRT